MIIRNMILVDLPQMVELEKICFSDPWSAQAFEYELNNSLSDWLVAVEDDGQVVGYIGSQTVLDESDMMNVAVLPEFRRKGIAEALIEELILNVKERESKSLSLEVRVSNIPAISLYEKLGFQQVGLRRNYYRNPKEDAYILRKELD